MSTNVLFVIGNTYQRLTESEARLNRANTNLKVHDWILFVDIVQGKADIIQSVKFQLGESFQPDTFICSSPITVILPDGSRVSRFSTHQQTTGVVVARVSILGRGKSHLDMIHPISLRRNGIRKPPARFVERSQLQPFKMAKIPDKKFGVELELSCSVVSSHQKIAQAIQTGAGVPVTIILDYSQVGRAVNGWKLVYDGSIACSRNSPNCTKFELVSPILKGESGLSQCSNVLRSLNKIKSITVNKSMAFHVHVDVESYELSSLIKICQNFVKYEDAIDSFMTPSRRTGSKESKQYCKSNRNEILGKNATNSQRNKALASCSSLEELCKLMNPTGRYYKLNLENLRTRRQPTFEFRQHSATSSYDKVNAWVRFCIMLTTNSNKLAAPKSLKSSRGIDEQFEMLFEYVIKDRSLRDIFDQRREEVKTRARHQSGHDAACCDGCESGHGCAALVATTSR